MRVEPWVEFYFYGVLLTSMCLFGISANTVTLFILNAFNEMRRQPINVYLTVLAIYDNGVLINALLMLGIPALVTNTKQNPSDYLPSMVLPSIDSLSFPASGPPETVSDSSSVHMIKTSPSSSSSSFYTSSLLPLSSSTPLSSSSSSRYLVESKSFFKNDDNHPLIVDDSVNSIKSNNGDINLNGSYDYPNTFGAIIDSHFNLSTSTIANRSILNLIRPTSWLPNGLIDSNSVASSPLPLSIIDSLSDYYHPDNLASSSLSGENPHQHQHQYYPTISSLSVSSENPDQYFPIHPAPNQYTEVPDDPLPYYVTIVYPMALIAQTGSIWTTCLITAERYFAVCHPFRIRTFSNRNRAIWAVIFLSVGAFLYNIPRFLEIEVFTTPEGSQSVRKTALRQNRLYYWLYYICLNLALLYIIPLSLLTALNTEIYKAIRRASRNRATLTNQEETELNIASMLVLLVSIFIACNAPAFVVNCMEFFNAPGYELAVIFSNLLVCLNSSINFVIYCIFGKKFRKKLGQVFHCSKMAQSDRLTNTNTCQARLNNNMNLNSVAITNVNNNTININNNNLNLTTDNNNNNNNNIDTNSMHSINETYV
ncbi:uncharacterized protein LOC128394837 [Panonychus citri]|uniref:uncharacterized protein LOC128394837 n=1 Tax=Panonychus citri TaxID=50023 RepID=UPI002307833C|nr:uncharacterized protein LOC128394837 [Panonychus citri]